MTYKIVHAQPDDLPELIEHALAFSKFLGDPSWELESAVVRIKDIMAGGFFPVVKKDGKIIAALGAVIHPSLWNIHILQLTEVFWWVGEEYRGTRAGAMLLKYFVTEAKKGGLRPVLHTLEHSPVNEKTLNRYGFYKKESTYYLGQ